MKFLFSTFKSTVDRIGPSEDVGIPRMSLQPVTMLYYMPKGTFCRLIKSRILRWEDHLGLSKWAREITKVFIKEGKNIIVREGDMTTEAEIREREF